MDASDAEREAVLLRFRADHPNAPSDALPTPEEESEILADIRRRQAEMEANAMRMLRRATHVAPTGQTRLNYVNARLAARFFYALGALVVLLVLALWVASRYFNF